MSNDDVDVFLAHYGVKGMKWGVVKTSASNAVDAVKGAPSNLKQRYENLTPTQQRNLKIAAGATLAIGAAAGAALLISYGNTPAASALAKKSVDAGKTAVTSLLNKSKGDLATKAKEHVVSKAKDEIFNGANLSAFNRKVESMDMDEVRDKARDYWTSPEGKQAAKNVNLDISEYTKGPPKNAEEAKKALDDPNYVWEL